MRDAEERVAYVIFNSYNDDHYRNLVARHRSHPAGRGPDSVQTRPNLRVDVRANACVEVDDMIATADDLNELYDLDFVFAEFGEDPLVYLGLSRETEGERSLAYLEETCRRFGLTMPAGAAADIGGSVEDGFTEAALFSAQYVVELV